MNTVELQHRFNLEVEKYFPHPLMSTLVEDYINYAYQQYITEKYDSLINPAEKFEITERLSRILAPLLQDIATSAYTAITTNSPYGIYITLPTNAQYIVKDKAVINYTDCNGVSSTKECTVIPIKHNRISSNRKNPYLKPADDEIWRVNFSDNKVELILYDGVTLSSYSCRYIKKQLAVNFITMQSMEIDSSVHEEIVLRATQIFLSSLQKNNTSNNVK